MMAQTAVPPILRAIEALKAGDRRGAAALLEQELREGALSGDRWRSLARLAAEIGEIDIALEASRRSADPPTLERLLTHCGNLAANGRFDESIEAIEGLEPASREHSSVLHFVGTIAAEHGRFEEAEHLYRRAIAAAPGSLETWFALAMIKTFRPDDPDLRTLESLADTIAMGPPDARARLLYALGKAYDDCGDTDRAFDHFARGAAIRKGIERYDGEARRRVADRLVRDFTAAAMHSLTPSQATERRPIFVTGLPRSGTTLVEQILTAHSKVGDGAEANLLRPALIPTLDFTLEGALAYQRRQVGNSDPWGDIGRDYGHFLDMRFRVPGRIVDKTLGLSAFMGLLLHSLPEAPVIWLRRDPEDVALSSFRTYFTASAPWSWSLADIASFMRCEDRLFEHWRSIAPERILVVRYEELARDPQPWIAAILAHAGLDHEAQVDRFYENQRAVQTASVRQVRSPVSALRIGGAERYSRHLEPFRAAYFG